MSLALPVPEWMDHAACATADPADFFPEDGEKATRAKALCAACPVRVQCLNWALETDCSDGVFGGMSSLERRRLRKGLSAATCPDCGRVVFARGLAAHRSRWCGVIPIHGHSAYSAGLCPIHQSCEEVGMSGFLAQEVLL